MSKKEEEKTKKEAGSDKTAPIPLLVVSWLVPGLGHLILRKWVRAAVFASVVLAAFITGLLLSGELAVPRRGEPFSYLAFMGCVCNGLLYFVCKLFGIGHGDPTAAGFSFGNTFLYTAGLMNMLTVLDVSDIFVGRKD